MVRILLVEDDPSFGYILSEYLLLQGFEVLWAKSGGEALEQLSRDQFSLAILDIMMPGQDGLSLLASLRETNSIPVILLTARDLLDDRLEGLRLGADDYLSKPISPDALTQ